MELEEAIAHAKKGDSLLFLGAGFSYGAKNQFPAPENSIPDAQQFANKLAAILEDEHSTDDKLEQFPLQEVAQYFEIEKGENGLIDELTKNFIVTEVQSYHQAVAKIPWRRVYSTNYDNCFEMAALKEGIAWSPLIPDSPIMGNKNQTVHINGHISNLTIESLKSQVKLTHSSYTAEDFAKSKWAQQLRQDAYLAKSIFFIGYSMSDIDIARIFTAAPEVRDRTFFIVKPNENKIKQSILKKFGTVLPIGIEDFADRTTNIKPYVDTGPHTFSWLQEYLRNPEPTEAGDDEAIDLIIRGVMHDDHLAKSMIENDSKYVVRRSEIDEILKFIDSGRSWFLLHSHLGNGKSIIKEQISYILSSAGWRVYWDSTIDNYQKNDLLALEKSEEKIAILVDESSEPIGVIEKIAAASIKNVVVFVCIRSTLFELGEARYENALPDTYVPIDLNRLSDINVKQIVDLFNHRGLWGNRARDIDSLKESFIKASCNRSLASLILSVIQNSDIGIRLKNEAFGILNSKSDVSRMLIIIFILNRLQQTPRPC